MSGKKGYLLILLALLVACAPAAEDEVSSPSQVVADNEAPDVTEAEHEEDSEHADDHDDDADEHDDDEHREHEAHEHGVAEMSVAWSGQDLLIDLETPGFNVLGFEYAPASDAEKRLFAESMVALESGVFLAFNAEAACTLLEAEVDSAYAEAADQDHADEAEHEGEAETHSDIDAAYSVRCENPAQLSTLDLSGLFTQFPNFAELRVQWVSDTAQSAQDLTPGAAVLELR